MRILYIRIEAWAWEERLGVRDFKQAGYTQNGSWNMSIAWRHIRVQHWFCMPVNFKHQVKVDISVESEDITYNYAEPYCLANFNKRRFYYLFDQLVNYLFPTRLEQGYDGFMFPAG